MDDDLIRMWYTSFSGNRKRNGDRDGSQQQNMPQLRQKNEAAVYRAAALQMWNELEKGHWFLSAPAIWSLLWNGRRWAKK